MINLMKHKLFIIGNGFDLAHNLPTRFDPNFKNIARKYEQDGFWDLYQSRENEIWSDFENLLGYPDFNSLEDIYEIVLSLLTVVVSKVGICPLCKKEIETNSCFHCNSKFLYFSKENIRFAWILNIFALNLEEESYEI